MTSLAEPTPPTRFLDREPKPGDRVHVEYRGICVSDSPYGGAPRRQVELDDGSGFVASIPDDAIVRVIAPEPAVGDVVTEDMDLPEGSIVENADETARLNSKSPDRWGTALISFDQLRRIDPAEWRIVRIGAAS